VGNALNKIKFLKRYQKCERLDVVHVSRLDRI
jgi:hypothetical protein